MFNELAAIFGQGNKSDELAQTSQPIVSGYPQPPTTGTTSVVPSGTFSGAELDAYQSRRAKILYEENQIQMLRAFFEVCQLPNTEQVMELSFDTGFSPDRVRNWFKSQRAREKAKTEGVVISALREEISKLRADLSRYKEALESTTCPHCGMSITPGEMPLSLSSSFPMPSHPLDFTDGSSDLPQSSFVQDEDVAWLF